MVVIQHSLYNANCVRCYSDHHSWKRFKLVQNQIFQMNSLCADIQNFNQCSLCTPTLLFEGFDEAGERGGKLGMDMETQILNTLIIKKKRIIEERADRVDRHTLVLLICIAHSRY